MSVISPCASEIFTITTSGIGIVTSTRDFLNRFQLFAILGLETTRGREIERQAQNLRGAWIRSTRPRCNSPDPPRSNDRRRFGASAATLPFGLAEHALADDAALRTLSPSRPHRDVIDRMVMARGADRSPGREWSSTVIATACRPVAVSKRRWRNVAGLVALHRTRARPDTPKACDASFFDDSRRRGSAP